MFQKFKTEIKWAFIFIAAQLIWMTLERVAGLHDEYIDKHPMVTWFFGIIAIVIYVLALKNKKKADYNGNISYKQAFISGIVITVIITVLSPLTQWLISNIITPDYFANAIRYSVDSGNVTQEAAEAYFNYPSYAIQGVIGALGLGVITTAIVSIFIRSKSN